MPRTLSSCPAVFIAYKIIEDSAQILSTNLCCKDALLEASRLLDSTWCKYIQIIYLPLQYSNNITMLSTVSWHTHAKLSDLQIQARCPFDSGPMDCCRRTHRLQKHGALFPRCWEHALDGSQDADRARFGPKEFINTYKHIIEIHRMEALPRRHLTSCWFCTSFLTSSNLLHCKKW